MGAARIFLMAQGQGSRWRPQQMRLPLYKHCLPIGGETLLGRTYRMLMEAGLPSGSVHVVAPADLLGEQALPGRTLVEPGRLLEGMVQCVEDSPFATTLIFLLGDVLFSTRALAAALRPAGLRFVGRMMANRLTGKAAPELFALHMEGRQIPEARRMMRNLVRRGESTPGKLWTLWDAMMTPPTVEVNDFTDDIDSPEELAAFWQPMHDAALAEA